VLTRYFALVLGIVYTLVGLAGFVPGLGSERTEPHLTVEANYQNVLGLFPVNVLHNLVHLAVGILGVLAFATFAAARTYARGLAIFYALLAVMGLIDAANLNTTFDLIPIFGHAVWLHALTAAAAGYVGFVGLSADRGGTLGAPQGPLMGE
jgi:hypothetical protein